MGNEVQGAKYKDNQGFTQLNWLVLKNIQAPRALA